MDWILSYPEKTTRQLLRDIYDANPSGFGRAREITFVLTHIKDQDVEILLNELHEKNWATSYLKKTPHHSSTVECLRRNYVLDNLQLQLDEKYFSMLANKYEITFDGWFTEIV
ncbi:hypothetical protein IPP75_01080 [Candidatus Saccharibacteria bacterium]|nr:MAG: hypothetical protein IPP75_01080 [Candidatus Saccharibacteria bacterium]